VRRFLITYFIIITSYYCAHAQYTLADIPSAEKKRFNKIRSHLRKIPDQQTLSITNLSSDINEVAYSDLEKAYAAFYWVASNITYDMHSFLKGITPPYRPKEVLQTRRAVCSGYAYLFNALCNELNLSSQILHGYSKGYGYDPSKPIEVSNHSWNSVQINNRWYLLDATWAASRSNDRSSTTPVRESFFLTHPKEFIKDHLPEDPKWQLLSPQLSLSDFEDHRTLQLNVQYALVINDDIEHIEQYVDIGTREVAMQKRILAFNSKNTNAVYNLGVALMYQALDTMDTMHQLNYKNVLSAAPEYKYRIYELLDQAALHFERVSPGPTYKSAQTFLTETTYQKGVFNYEVAQVIYDTTLPLTKEEYEPLKKRFAEARIAYYKIAIEYFKYIPPSSWYYENSQSYLSAISEEKRDVSNALN
jgi:hypothetical protein